MALVHSLARSGPSRSYFVFACASRRVGSASLAGFQVWSGASPRGRAVLDLIRPSLRFRAGWENVSGFGGVVGGGVVFLRIPRMSQSGDLWSSLCASA